MRDIVLGAALGALIEFVFITGLVLLAERFMPRVKPRVAELVGGMLVATTAGVVCLATWSHVQTIEEHLGVILLNLAFALWAMLVLHFALLAQQNQKKLGDLDRLQNQQFALLDEMQKVQRDLIEAKLGTEASRLRSYVIDKTHPLDMTTIQQSRAIETIEKAIAQLRQEVESQRMGFSDLIYELHQELQVKLKPLGISIDER